MAVLTTLFLVLLLPVAASWSGWLWCNYLTQPGQIFSFVRTFFERLKFRMGMQALAGEVNEIKRNEIIEELDYKFSILTKPFYGCDTCVSGWMGILFYIWFVAFYDAVIYDPVAHFIIACASMFIKIKFIKSND